MISVAIDGPAGAGKSTISKAVAKELGFIYFDTGSLYRCIAYYFNKNDICINDLELIKTKINNINIDVKFIDEQQCIFINNENVTGYIRTPEMSIMATKVAGIELVRGFLFNLQREMAEKNNIIMDGRDIGTVILPNAKVKIFLTATAEDRAIRRFEQLKITDNNIKYEDVLNDIKQRDFNDENREISPLKKAQDAILLDTTGNTLEQSIELLTKTIKERL